jgi:hypothetical protein
MAIQTHGIGPRHTPQRGARLWRRWWFWAIIALVVILIGAVAWLGLRAFAAKSALEAAQSQVATLKTQATTQRFAAMSGTMKKLERDSGRAAELTSDPIWRLAEHVPMIGNNLTVVRKLAASTDSVVIEVVAPLVSVAAGLTPASFAPVNGAINLDPLAKAVPAVARAKKSIDRISTQLDAIDTRNTIGQVSNAKTKLSTLVTGVRPLLDSANTFLPLLPPFMGADKPRNYVVMFQNSAESRALGGTALSFALLRIDKGKASLVKAVSAGFGHFNEYPTSVVPVPAGNLNLYGGGFGRSIANSTLRPQFSTAAQIVDEYWRRQFGLSPDGVISVDLVALSYVLRATTPITLPSGDVLTPGSLVPLLLNGAYLRFNTGNIYADNVAQGVLYGDAVAATFAKLSGGPLDVKLLIAALQQGYTEGRLHYWSADAKTQAILEKAGLSGALPVSDAATDRVGVYFQDNVGSKLNFYLNQTVHLGQAACRTDGRATYRVGVDLASSIPVNTKTLSPSILGDWKTYRLKPGVQRMFVYVYAPPGSQISGATVNGAAVAVPVQHDENYPVARLLVSVAPGATVTVSVDITAEKAGAKALLATVTPMVHNTPVVPAPLDCSTVAKG